MLKQQILSRKYGNISSVLGEIFLPYFLKKLYIMHTPEKDKFWQSRGQRFDPANICQQFQPMIQNGPPAPARLLASFRMMDKSHAF